MRSTPQREPINTKTEAINNLPKITYIPHQRLQPEVVQRIAELRENHNLSIYDIARIVGCHPTTAYRQLIAMDKTKLKVKKWKDNRADAFAYQQMEEEEIQALIREELLETDSETGEMNLRNLSVPQKGVWYDRLNTSRGTNYDKERLERDLSTANVVSIIADLEALREAHNDT